MLWTRDVILLNYYLPEWDANKNPKTKEIIT